MSDSGRKSEERLLKKIKKYQDRLSRRRRRRGHRDSSDRSRSRSCLRSPDIIQENIDTQINVDLPNHQNVDFDMSPEALENNNAMQDLTEHMPPQRDPNLLEPYREVLGKDYEQPDKFEGMIQEDIAKRWSYFLIKGLTKADRDDILKKHKVPLNCKLLEAPILNEEVNAVLTDSSKQRDKAIETQQHQLGLATSIIGQVMSHIIEENNQAQIPLFKLLTDALKLLVDLNQQQTRTRRLLISPLLDKNFNHMVEAVERDEYLYGINLTEKIKANKQILMSSTQIKKLPVRHGGLGVRCASEVCLPAFLASVHGVVDLVTQILPSNGSGVIIPFAADAINAWKAINPSASLPAFPHNQRAWDEIGCQRVREAILDGKSGVELARLRAVSQPEAGAWLQALPSPYCGTLLDDSSLRVAVALRLGCDVCEPHQCICGSRVESNGHHALSCCRCAGRFPRHHALNDIVRRALISANIPCVLEPPGLSRTDGKRPDGLTMVPWEKGRSLLWDATCVSTVAASHLARTVVAGGAAADFAAAKKREKYAILTGSYNFVPLAFETLGSWGEDAKRFVKELGRRLRQNGGDKRAGSFLAQRLSIAVQRGNAASIMGTFAPGMTRGGLFID